MATPSVQRYTAIDSNKYLIKPYMQLVDAYYGPMQTYLNKDMVINLDYIGTKSEDVDFSNIGSYDCVFSCPPYFTLEKYKDMPSYENMQMWCHDYLRTVM